MYTVDEALCKSIAKTLTEQITADVPLTAKTLIERRVDWSVVLGAYLNEISSEALFELTFGMAKILSEEAKARHTAAEENDD